MSVLPPEDDVLAAEYALRLLDDEAVRVAQAREADDPAFAVAVADWNERLFPWLDGVAPVVPDDALWDRIQDALMQERQGEGTFSEPPRDNVVALKRKVRTWRIATGALTALAASLALVVGLRFADKASPVAPPAARASDLAVAAIAPEGAVTALAVVSYDRVSASLIVTPAGLTQPTGRSHELWVVPASGAPKSLGLLDYGAPRRIVLAEDFAKFFAGEATIAISTEQQGGSRTGLPVGPIIGTGKLRRI